MITRKEAVEKAKELMCRLTAEQRSDVMDDFCPICCNDE